MPKCNFNKVALQLYWNHTLAWVFSCKFAAYLQNTFSYEHLWIAASEQKIDTSINIIVIKNFLKRFLMILFLIFDILENARKFKQNSSIYRSFTSVFVVFD